MTSPVVAKAVEEEIQEASHLYPLQLKRQRRAIVRNLNKFVPRDMIQIVFSYFEIECSCGCILTWDEDVQCIFCQIKAISSWSQHSSKVKRQAMYDSVRLLANRIFQKKGIFHDS